MLRKLKLYGELAKFVGHKEFEIKVNNVAQAVSFLVHNFPEVEKHMNPKYYQVKVGSYEIGKEEIAYPIGKEDIHFVPVVTGSGGVGKALLGVALIGLAFATGGSSLAFGLGGFTGGAGISAIVGNVGIALTLMGVSEMLFPMPQPPKFSSEQDPRLSFSFSGVQNTSRAGTPVPIVYGEIFTGSVVISAAVDTNQVEG